jgi:TorA maturation chaperone TorD
MSRAWNALCAASEAMDADAAQTEFDALFGGVGRPLITVFGSFHIAGFVNEKPLARLRDDLAGLGLQRSEGESQPEDHIAALADVMRLLLTDTTRGRRRACRTAGPLFRHAHRALVRVPVR